MTLTNDELRELLHERSPSELLRIAERVKRVGGCERPIRLKATGVGSASRDEADGVLLIACKSRRETRCAPCAATYRGDARWLVRAGIEGGKGVPETVSSHPAVFVTLTAPSFGAVHRAGGICHVGRPGRCPHGRPGYCLSRHGEQEEILGSPICPDCYDYEGAVLFNATAGELWRRVTIYVRRHLAYLLGRPEREVKEEVRLSYLKVAELQRRGVVHLHAIVRADAATDDVLAPPGEVTTEHLSKALIRAVASVYRDVTVGNRTRRLVFGEQVKVDPLPAGEVKGVASYLAKYLSKEASGNGSLDHRLREGEIELLELPEHLRRIVETAWRLGSEPDLGRVRRWAHALGYTGHLMTKSRRYSTTFSALRALRQAWRQVTSLTPERDFHGSWIYAGSGWKEQIDGVLSHGYREQRCRSRLEYWSEVTIEEGA